MSGALFSDRPFVRRNGRTVHVSMSSLVDLVADTLPTSGGAASSVAWADVTGKPTSFTPSAHTHVIADVTGLQGALDAKQVAGSYAAAAHTHVIADVTGLQAALDGKQVAGSYQPLATVLTNTTAAFTTAQETKLAGIATGATANASDSALRDRSTHTGTQAAETITGLATVATSGAYDDLSGRPTLATVATTGAYSDLTGNPSLPLSGEATVTLANGVIECVQTVSATGVSASNKIVVSLSPTVDADENDPEMLDLKAVSARPLTDQIEIIANFGTPTSGPVKFNWSAF